MVRKLWFYNPPSNKAEAPVEFMAKHTDVVCMTMGEEREQYLRDMRAAGFKGEIWLYWLQNSVHAVSDPNRNNVGYQPGTFKDLLTRVPDIFQYGKDGEIVRKNDRRDYVVCDVAHPEWQKLFKARTEETINRNRDLWTGIWDDDLNVIFHVNAVGPVETRKYGKPDSPAYFEAFKGWLEHQRDGIAKPLGLRFGGNLQGSDLAKWEKSAGIMAKNNGHGAGVVMNEFQFFTHEGEYLSAEEWKKDLKKVEIATKQGAEVWNVCPINAKQAHANPTGDEAKKIYFFMASHLLAADERAAVRIGREYALAYYFPILDEVDRLGKPKGVYTVDGDEYRREFEGGMVIVRPGEQFADIQYTPIVEPPTPPTEEKPAIKITLKGVTLTVDEITIEPAGLAEVLTQLLAGITGKLAA